MVLNFNKIKACDSSLSIILINFKRVRIPSFNRESLSGIICVANQKNKIVDKLGWLFTDSNSYYVIYINYYKVAYYLGTGVKFRITTKTSVGIILHISRGMTYFFHGCHDYHLGNALYVISLYVIL